MSDEDRPEDQERTMFDSSLLARIQDKEREEEKEATSDRSLPTAPPPPSVPAIPTVPAPPQSTTDLPRVPPPPSLQTAPLADHEAEQEKPSEPSLAEDAPEASEPEEQSELSHEEIDLPIEEEALESPQQDDEEPPEEEEEEEPASGEAPGDADEDLAAVAEHETGGPDVVQPAGSSDSSEGYREPETAPEITKSAEGISHADGTLRAIPDPTPVEDLSVSDLPDPTESSAASSESEPSDEQGGTEPRGELGVTEDIGPRPDSGETDFADSDTEDREALDPGADRTHLEPTRPGLSTGLTSEAKLPETTNTDQPSVPTRPQLGSALPQTQDLWAEGSVDALARSESSKLKAEETAMLPTPDAPETGDIEQLEADPEYTEEEPGITLICDQGGAQPVHLRDSPVIIGRGQAADITILEPTLSRKHCQLELRSGKVWITDLGSGNGTYLDDERVVGSAELKAGSRLRLGHMVTFSLPDGSEPAPSTEVEPEAQPMMIGSPSGPTIMPEEGGFSTTDARNPNLLRTQGALRTWLPLGIASLLFLIGVVTQVLQHRSAQAKRLRLDQADSKLVEGIALYQKGQLKEAQLAIKAAGAQDPAHPMLPLYRSTLNKLMVQQSQLDDVEKLISQGDLEKATARLVSLQLKEELKARGQTLTESMGKVRSQTKLSQLAKLVEAQKIEEAKALYASLKAAGTPDADLERFEKQLGKPQKETSRKTVPRRSTPTGPLARVQRALRSGQIEEAYRINRDLASSGVKEAASMEGNLAELRELLNLSETAIQRRDHSRALAQTKRALRLLKQISPQGVGARNKLQTLRAKAYQAEAQQHGREGRICEARQSLDRAARLNPNIAGLANAFRVVENHGSSELAGARDDLARGASLPSVRSKLEMAICTHSSRSKVAKEAKRLLRGR